VSIPPFGRGFSRQRAIDQASDKTAIHPFHVNVPETELTELRRRINATKWSERETVTDASQGVQLATIQPLARYWAAEPTHQGITSKTIDKVTEYGGNILIPPRTLQQDEQMAILREREVYQLIGQVALQPFDKSSM